MKTQMLAAVGLLVPALCGQAGAGYWTAPEPFPPANTAGAQDWKVLFTDDHLSFYLHSELDGYLDDTQIYRVDRPDAASPWGSPAAVSELNTGDHDFVDWVSPDRTAAFLTRHGDTVPETFGDLYRTTRSAPTDPWGAAAPVDELSTLSFESGLHVTADGLRGIFCSVRTAGEGGMDLWETSRPDLSSPWAVPVPVPELNTVGDERDAHLSADGLTVFFRRQDIGLLSASRASLSDPFSEPAALGIDGGLGAFPTLSLDQGTLYFSMPTASADDHDIYFSTYIPEPASLPVLLLGVCAVWARRR